MPAREALYQEYRDEVEREHLPRALVRAAFTLFAISTAFIGVDAVVYPDKVADFLPTRIGLDLILVGVYFAARRFSVASAYTTVAAGAWMLYTVVDGTGGATSGYYVGLVLLVIGIGVLAPLSVKQASWMIGGVFTGYLLLSLNSLEGDSWNSWALSVFFLGAAAFEGVMSCAYMDRMRFVDFAQRRELEQARDALAQLDVAKSRFTANIHHELRTPLTLTLAPVETLLAGDIGEVSPAQRGYLETIRSNGLRLLKLINNLLDLAKIEGQQLEVKRRALQVGEVIEGLVAGARPLAQRKGVALDTRGLAALPVIHADPEALEKIVVNLLGNALKFTSAGGRIEISGEARPDGVQLHVQDDGVGIPPEELGRIFDRFAQVDASNTRKHEGTGIGLSLTRELVALHGGEIWAESEGLGHGTRMCFSLPTGEPDVQPEEQLLLEDPHEPARRSFDSMEAELDLGEGEGEAPLSEMERHVERSLDATHETASASAPEHPAGTPEVLVVEDNPDMRKLLAFLVGREFRVRVARNGREGLEAARASAPDLILTDVMMPEMSGTELCAAIKGDPETQRIPVVLVTSKAEREMKIQGLELGADDYVTKPFHPRELLARVRSLVRLRGLQDEIALRNEQLESTNGELRSTLSELKEASAALVHAERLAVVGELAAGVAHEVNNPVNFAMNAVKTLRSEADAVREVAQAIAELEAGEGAPPAAALRELAKLRDRVRLDETVESLSELSEIAIEGLTRTSELVGDLRDFAAPDGRRGQQVDLVRGLRSTLRLVGHGFSREGIEVELRLPEDLPRVNGETRAFNQVFLNLLKNAAEAFEGRGGSITIEAQQRDRHIVFEIRDDGPGIPSELQARIFEPFFTTRGDDGGSGLGLSICRRIVEEHGGRIELLPGEACGTTARLTLPLPDGTEAPHAS